MIRRFHTAASILALAAVYFCAGKFGLLAAFANASATAVWPPTGIALAVLLLWGYRLWPGIFLGAFLVNITTQGSVGTTLGIAAGNTLEACVAAGLVNRFAEAAKVFDRPRTLFRFVVLAAILSPLVSASVGVSSLCLGGFVRWDHYPVVWLTWWLGDMVSNLIVAPMLIIWATEKFTGLESKQLYEGAGLLAAMLLAGRIVFWGKNPFASSEYLSLLPLLWAAFRFGKRGAVAAAFVMSNIALWGTLYGFGPFATPDRNESLMLLQAFMGTITITGLVLASVVAERDRTQQRLQIQNVVAHALAGAPATPTTGSKILQALCEAAKCDLGIMWRVNPQARELFCAETWHAAGLAGPAFAADTRQRKDAPGEGLAGRVWSAGKPLWISDVTKADNLPCAQMALETGVRAAVGFPIRLGEDILGVIECFSREVREPSDGFVEMLTAIGSQIGQFLEHQRVEEAVRESEERFRQVTENITEVFWLTDAAKRRMLYISPGYEKIWGRSCRSLYASPRDWLEAIHPEDRERVLEAALTKQIAGQYDESFRITRPDGSIRWIRDQAFPVQNASGEAYRIVGIAQDITERTQAQRRLRELAAIVENSDDAIISKSLDGKIVSWNKAAERIYGYTGGEMIGQSITRLLPPDRENEEAEILRRLSQGKGVKSYETVRRRKDGSLVEISLTISPIRDATNKVTGASAIGRDISERKELERQVLESSANERRRIGHDLHDGLGQYLAGIAFKTKALEEVLAAEAPAHAPEARELVRLMNDAIGQARSLARGLAPVDVEAHGLLAALQNLAAETESLFRLRCVVGCKQDEVPVNTQTGTALYRITQEAIHNAVTHGQAQRIEIELDAGDQQLCLRIRDNGKGFCLEAEPQSGMGLRLMQYRARSIGGSLAIQSQVNEGTEVQCLVPAQRARQNGQARL